MFNIKELTCRVCLQEREVLINIYDELEELKSSLSDLLETCANIQIDKNDCFPKYLCEDCTRELLITSKFLEKCDKSKAIIIKLIENAKLLEDKELSNASDLIEYCEDVTDDEDLNNLIIQESTTNEENADEAVNEIKQIDQNCEISSLNNCIIEQANESGNSFENFSHTEETVDPENASWQETDSMNKPKPLRAKSKKHHNFKCDVCGALFIQVNNLQKHLHKLHNTLHFYTCSKCEHCFSIETEFYKHVEECVHLESSSEDKAVNIAPLPEKLIGSTTKITERNRNCMFCNRSFPTPFALRMHLRTHTGERPFQCKYCPKSFKTQYHLNVHHKRHSGQADFICVVCNKGFYEQSNLLVHMRSHTGERPHICVICNKTFARVFLLQFHMRTHTGEKPFQCNYCDKRFRQNSDLRCHLTIHTGNKQHVCVFCTKSYAKRPHLVQHMRKHHVTTINSAESEETLEFSNVNSRVKSSTAENIIQQYAENSEVYTFGEIIESEDVVANA